MGATFETLWGEVMNTFPNLSPFLAKRFVQRSVEDIYDSHQWSFLMAEGYLYAPGEIATGTFSITKFSTIVTANSVARAALSGLSNPPLTKRQIRFSGRGQLYNIVTVDANFSVNGLLTLDRPIVDDTTTTASYMCYRCYYTTPLDGTGTEVTDFLRYNTIYNPAISDWFRGIQAPRDLLNKIDPQRTNVGNNPYYLFDYKATSDGTPMFEMWPHPTSEGAFLTSYQRMGIIPSADSDVLPRVIPDDLVLQRAFYYGCLWAHKNQLRYPNLKANWMLIAQEHRKAYSNFDSRNPGLLEQTIVQDEEIFPQSLVIDDRAYRSYAIGDDDRTGFFSINPNP